MLDQRENMFQNIFCSDYFGFNCPFDCAKQINIQNTLLIKLSSAYLQKQNTRLIYAGSHLKKYSVPLNHAHCKPSCFVSSLSLPRRQFCTFFGVLFPKSCLLKSGCWQPWLSPDILGFVFLSLTPVGTESSLSLGRKLGLSLAINAGFADAS